MVSDSDPIHASANTSAFDILFVDDDQILRLAFTELLRIEGFSVHAVGDGRQALEFLARERPRLVITDIFMPDTDGLELIMGLRRCWPECGVLAISGGTFGPPELLLKTARLIGKVRTLPKPFGPDELIAVVKDMLNPPATAGHSFVDYAGG